jgi:hypothetical protein
VEGSLDEATSTHVTTMPQRRPNRAQPHLGLWSVPWYYAQGKLPVGMRVVEHGGTALVHVAFDGLLRHPTVPQRGSQHQPVCGAVVVEFVDARLHPVHCSEGECERLLVELR